MNRKKYSGTLLSVLVLNALGLTGCEETDYAAQSCLAEDLVAGEVSCATTSNDVVTGVEEYSDKGGVNGRVFGEDYWVGATVCFDINRNGLCDTASEPTEKTFEQGQYSFEATAVEQSIADQVSMLALAASSDSALYAKTPALSTSTEVNLTPFTTLVASEMVFNPYTVDSASDAISSLGTSGTLSFGDDATLEGQDYIAASDTGTQSIASDLSASLASVQAQDTAQHYQATAALIDAMYQQTRYNATVTLADIDLQQAIGATIDATLNDTSVSWGVGDADEASVVIHAQDGIGIVGSTYHNRLIVLDVTADAEPTVLSLNNFASSPGDRYDIDAVTGASEQALTDVRILPDKRSAIVGVKKYNSDSEDTGVGIYRADLSNLTAIPETLFAGETDNSSDFYAFAGLNAMALSEDGTTVALAGEDKAVTVLDATDFSVLQTITFGSKVRSIAISSDGSTIYAALFGARIGLVGIDVATGNELGFLATSGTDYPQEIHILDAENQVAFYQRDGSSLMIYDIDGTTLTLSKQVDAADKIKSMSFSKTTQQVALGVQGGRLELHAIDDQPVLIDAFQTEPIAVGGASKPINSVAFLEDAQVLVSVKNGVQVLSISESSATDWSDLEKQDWFNSHRSER